MKKEWLYVGSAGALLFIGIFLGHIMTSIIFLGFITACSIVTLVESSRSFKKICGRFGFMTDLLLFILSALAVAKLGVTIAGSLAVASLLYTVYRVVHLAPWFKRNFGSEKKRSIKSYVSQAVNWCIDGIKSLFTFKSKTVEA